VAVRVAVDASSAATGGGITYLREMLPRLHRQVDVEIVAVLVRSSVVRHSGLDQVTGLPLVTGEGRFAAVKQDWRRVVTSRRTDVVFTPTEISFTRYRCPLVLVLRNAVLGHGNVQEYKWKFRQRVALQRSLARQSARWAAAHVAVSQYAARIASSDLGIAPTRVQVVHHGGPGATPHPLRNGPVRRFLVVSNLYRYKNVHRLIAALASIDRHWQLEVVGRALDAPYVQELKQLAERSGVSDRVDFVGQLSESELEAAYERGDCLVWPSYVETFGHPMLEAHSHGLPIIAADAASNREIAGPAAQYFEPFDVAGLRVLLSRAMEEGLPSGPLPRLYNWDTCAEKTSAVLCDVVR
jgi:glycosyltransferase involved in cell wall biosynthesis